MDKARTYNQRVIDAGLVTTDVLTQLTQLWQEKHNLQPDGLLGPVTLATLQHDSLGARIVSALQREYDKGEPHGGDNGNNRGPDVERYRAGGSGKNVKGNGAWCAELVSYVLNQAGTDFVAHGGAKRVTKNIAAKGSWVIAPKADIPAEVMFKPGDVICWHRGKVDPQSWQGHVEIVVRYDEETDTLYTGGGNHNNRTDSGGKRYAVVGDFTYTNGTWRHRLFAVARPSELTT